MSGGARGGGRARREPSAPAASESVRRHRGWLGSFAAASAGVVLAWRHGRNLRVQVAAGYAALLLASWLHLSGGRLAAVVLAVGLVLAAEAANTAIEGVVDLLHPRFGPRAGQVKDLAAGAVLLAAAAAAGVAAVVFLPALPALGSAVALRLRAAPVISGAEVGLLLLLVGAAVRGMR